jgi:hypothetical protein
MRPSFKNKVIDRFSDIHSVLSLNLPAMSTKNTSIASNSQISFYKVKSYSIDIIDFS